MIRSFTGVFVRRKQQQQDVTVRFEPCEAWTVGPDVTSGSCLECGWLEEDHWLAELDRRPVPV